MNREIEARLKISAVDRTGKVLQGVGNKLGYVNQRAEQFNRTQTLAAKSAQSMFSLMARYAGPAALGAAAVYSTKAAASFEDALFNIQKKSGATTEQMSKLRDEIRQLGGELPVSIDEIASAFERGAAAGIPLDELKEFSKLTAGVADAWDTTAETTANFFAGFTAGMGISRKDLQAYASLINDLADSGIADETDIADFIDRAGASLKNFGMTPEEIAAYGAALLNLKLPAEVGARAMDTVTGKLLAPENLSDKSYNALTAIVGDMEKFSKLSGNAKLQFFLTKVEKLGSQRRASLLGALLGEGFDDEIMRLVAGSEEVRRNLGLAEAHVRNPSNSILETQAKGLEKFNSQLQILGNNLKNIATEAGEELVLPWLTQAMKDLNGLLKQVEDQKKASKGLSWAEEDQQRKKFIEDWKKNNPDQWFLPDRKAIGAYGEAMAAVGRGEIGDVNEYNAREARLNRAINQQNKPSTGRHQRPIALSEFTGVDHNYDPRNLPETGVPIPRDRNAPTQADIKLLRDQYRLYNSGRVAGEGTQIGGISIHRGDEPTRHRANREMLRNADPAALGMDGMGGILIEGGEQAGQKIADGSKEGADFFDRAASAIRLAGQEAASAIERAVQSAAAFNRTMAASTGAGAPARPAVNADTGRSMPPQKPGGGGW